MNITNNFYLSKTNSGAPTKGSLPPSEREQFDKQFLIFPDERKRVGVARAMIGELSNISVETAPEPVTARREEKTRWQWLLDLFGFRTPTIGFAMAAAAMLVVTALVWLAFETSRLHQQISQLEAQQRTQEEVTERESAEERARVEKLTGELEDERNCRALLEQELAQQA